MYYNGQSWKYIATPWKYLAAPWKYLAAPWKYLAAPWKYLAAPWKYLAYYTTILLFIFVKKKLLFKIVVIRLKIGYFVKDS